MNRKIRKRIFSSLFLLNILAVVLWIVVQSVSFYDSGLTVFFEIAAYFLNFILFITPVLALILWRKQAYSKTSDFLFLVFFSILCCGLLLLY